MAARRLTTFAAILSAALAAACSTTRDADPEKTGLDAATEDQIRTRIANFATLRDVAYNENVEVLGGIMKPYSIPFLLESLEGSSNAMVRAGCAMALGMARDGRAVEPLVRIMERDPEQGMRLTAAYNLCLFQDSRGLPPLLKALRSSNPGHRFRANARLVEVTGKDFGYKANDSVTRRAEAAARWDAWYQEVGPQGAAIQLLRKGDRTP